MAAFATSADMIARYDERTLADLCTDTDTPEVTLSSNAKMLAALDDATGEILSLCTVGNLYSQSDLEGLTGESASYLKRITCELAIVYLIENRIEKWGADAVKNARDRSDRNLDRLRRGEKVFDVSANREAGLPTVDGPRVVDYERLNLIPDRTRNYYPQRAGRLPLGRG